MNKQEILKPYKNEEKMLVAKLLDKLEYCSKYSKISNTNFINEKEEKIAINVLNKIRASNYVIYGGYKEARQKDYNFLSRLF